jgi:hypothetical protein
MDSSFFFGTLKTYGASQGKCHLREWVIEGSNDGSTWEILDRRNTEELNGYSIVKTFGCSSAKSSDFFRFVRLKQTGKNCRSGWEDHILVLTNIEFFGTLETNSA